MSIHRKHPEVALRRHPYDWAVIGAVFDEHIYEQLLREFPDDGFVLTESAGQDGSKSYRTYNLSAMNSRGRTAKFSSLSVAWQKTVDWMVGRENIAFLEDLTKRALSGTASEVRFVVYSKGCWIAPHLDRADKRLTQIFYFQGADDDLVGGDLLILGSSDVHDVVERVAPRPNSSVVLVPSAASWHAVSTLEETSSADRRCVLVHFTEKRG